MALSNTQRLAEREAARAEAAAKAAAERAEVAAEARLAALDALDEAESKLGAGRVALVDTAAGPAVLRAPSAPVYQRFCDGEINYEAQAKLVIGCLSYPDRVVFDRWLDEYPGILTKMSDQVMLLAGFQRKALEGK
jgi:glutathione S-transferase